MTCSQIRCLLTVLELSRERGKGAGIASKDIADRMEISRPSVHRLLDCLDKAGYIIKIYYGPVLLTDAGREEAERLELRCRHMADSLALRYEISRSECESAALLLMSGLREDSLAVIEGA